MTAELNEIECAEKKETDIIEQQSNAEAVTVLPAEILDIFEYLSLNDKIIFKSQQIDDDELQRSEKIQIAQEIYEKNRQTFLLRFGSHLQERHLTMFAQLAISDGAVPLKVDENYDEMQLMLRDFQQKLRTRKRDVKNRRYAAMQELIKKGEYFSELEMMKRAPELYQELIGQYLSEAEKKQRDSYDVRNTTFSGILMHTAEQQRMEEVLTQADRQNQLKELKATEDETKIQNAEIVDTQDDAQIATQSHADDNEIPVGFRQQWGNFDNEQIACSKSATIKQSTSNNVLNLRQKKTNTKFITGGERDLLRQEFIGIMHEQFLAGNDEDFDYTLVDDNSQLDDLQQLNQDKEDAYFEASDDDDDVIAAMADNNDGHHGNHNDEESEDELDIYMNHLSKHHSLRT